MEPKVWKNQLVLDHAHQRLNLEDFGSKRASWIKQDGFEKSVLWYLGADEHVHLAKILLENAPEYFLEVIRGIATEGSALSSWVYVEEYLCMEAPAIEFGDDLVDVFVGVFVALVKRTSVQTAACLRSLVDALDRQSDAFVRAVRMKLDAKSEYLWSLLAVGSEGVGERMAVTLPFIHVKMDARVWIDVLKKAINCNTHPVIDAFLGFGAVKNQEKESVLSELLCFSCFKDEMHWMEPLLELGANVNAKDATFRYPMYYAVQNDNEAMVAKLLSWGANPLLRSGKNGQGASAKYLALKSKSTKRLKCLSLIERDWMVKKLQWLDQDGGLMESRKKGSKRL